MELSTQDGWRKIVPQAMQIGSALPDRVLAHLTLLDGDFGGFPIDRYSHWLLTATLALKAGSDDEYGHTAEFVELFDNPAFDASLEILPISTFEPLLRRVMAVPKNSVYKAALDRQSVTQQT